MSSDKNENDLRAKVNAKDNPIIKLIGGQQVCIELRNGSIYTGQICAYKAGLINLGEFDVDMRESWRLSAAWVLIDRSQVVAIWPAPKFESEQ